jgi:hypothetical protein
MDPVPSNALRGYAAAYRNKSRGAGVRSTEGGFPPANPPYNPDNPSIDARVGPSALDR